MSVVGFNNARQPSAGICLSDDEKNHTLHTTAPQGISVHQSL